MTKTNTKTRKTGIFAKRVKGAWDVDKSKAKHIYGQFKQFDRPESAFKYIDLDADALERIRYHGAADPAQVKRLVAAAKMVQTFVDALSGEQSNYTVSLDPFATTASTDLRNRVMSLPSKTILDPSITDEEASLLMVAFMGHEIGHVRYDNNLDKALQDDGSILEKGVYNALSTILREARVEAGFSDLFPGYSGLFEPMLRWISRGTKDGSTPPQDALGFAVAATRYPFRFKWSQPEHIAERDWWVKWVDQYARVEDYAGHKAALDLAYDHIKQTLPQQPGQGQGQPQDGGDPSDQSGQDQGQPTSGNPSAGQGAGTGTSSSPAPYTSASGGSKSDYQLESEKANIDRDRWNKINDLRSQHRDGTLDYDEMWDKIQEAEKEAKAAKAKAAREKNAAEKAQASIPASIEQVDGNAMLKQSKRGRSRRNQSQEDSVATRKANEELGLDYQGQPIKAAPLSPPQTRKGLSVQTDYEATSIFRSMFMRMRGGNDGRIGGKRSGRLDDRRIYRLADRRDDRVFTRRGAPKTQHLRVYLMVDTSGSMGGDPERQIKAVAKSLIEASIGADNLTLEVWGWDTTVSPVWVRGEDPDNVMRLNARGGTNDTGALRFAVDRMQKELRQEEHGLIIMMSDGQGNGATALRMQAERARTFGMSVFGITMSSSLDQTNAYGKDGFVQWQGSVSKTAFPLAQIIQTSWVSKDQHRA